MLNEDSGIRTLTGRIFYGQSSVREMLLQRTSDLVTVDPSAVEMASQVFGEALSPQEFVARVIEIVRAQGDNGVRRIAQGLGDESLPSFELSADILSAACDRVDPGLDADFNLAADRIRAFSEQEMPSATDNPELGIGQRWVPVDRAGIHVPGLAAPLASTLLMSAIPARVAGVSEIVVSTPIGPQGVSPAIALAARIANVDRVFGIGGAQAIAAMALGTEAVPRCDVIAGAGNAWVVLAKQALYGTAGIALLPGPTETLVVADASADPADVAADLIAQAEHGGPASPICLTTEASLASRIVEEFSSQVSTLPRGSVACDSFVKRGGIGVIDTLAEAIVLANEYAPEHLCLLVADPDGLLPNIVHAGGVFVGTTSPEVFGDYVAGPSHIMPTGGTARFMSPLGVRSFLKSMAIVRLPAEQASTLAPVAARMARAEGLEGHARAADRRGKS